MRILWSSNSPYASTGYGNQTRLFTSRIQQLGHDVAILPFYGLEGGVINWGSIPLYPKGRDGYGNDVMGAHALHWRADILITLIDAWVLNPQAVPESVAWCPWFPIDMEPIPPPVLRQVSKAHTPIVYSRFGERMAQAANLEALYVPHGIDTQVLSPLPQKDARERLKWHPDAFIFGMVAANKGFPSRKSYPAQFEAFSHFSRKHADAYLYVHANDGSRGDSGGVNLKELADHLGITERVIFPDQYQLSLGFPDTYMQTAYSAMDALLSVSMGEGFGIPIVEAQSCGCPVIVGDWTSMAELCFAGWKVAPEVSRVPGYGSIRERTWTPLAAYQEQPRIGAVLEVMEAAYNATATRQGLRAKARRGAEDYDADLVARVYWKPALETIAERLGVEVAHAS